MDSATTSSRDEDFEVYFRNIAVLVGYVDASRGANCTRGLTHCTYDPTERRNSPTDVHYSDALNRFTAPDGTPWVWLYVQRLNEWFIAEESVAPVAYNLILTYVKCILSEEND